MRNWHRPFARRYAMSPNPLRFRLLPDLQQGGTSLTPLPCRTVSNEEFAPTPQTETQALIEHLAWQDSERLARRLGLTRRDFLRTTGGMALALLTMNRVFGRFFDVSDIEAAEPAAFAERSGPRYFIFDVQTHYVSTAYDPSSESRSHVIPREALLRL